MKIENYKALIIILFTLFIVIVLGFAWRIEAVREDLAIVQDELAATQEELVTTQENYRVEIEKSVGLSEKLNTITNELNSVSAKLEEANGTIADLKSNEYKLVYMGDFKLTHYCPGYHGAPCGTGDGITATGTKVTAGRTIAVDPKKIPYGSKVYIEGYGWRVAEDCGGSVKGNHIDIAMNSHTEAINMGTKTGGVWLLVKN